MVSVIHGLQSSLVNLIACGIVFYQLIIFENSFLALLVDSLNLKHHDFEEFVFMGFHSLLEMGRSLFDYCVKLGKVIFDLKLKLLFGH